MTLTLLDKPDTETIPQMEVLLIQEQPTDSEHFTIDTPEKAAWAVRKLLESQERVTRSEEQASAYKARIDKWFEQSIKEDEDSIAFFKSLLRPYVETQITHQRKSRTLHLPGAAVSIRKKPDRIDVTDKETTVSFCEMNHPAALIVKKEVSKSYLKELLAKGEIIPGCTVQIGEDEFYFKDEQ